MSNIKEIDVNGLFDALNKKGEAKLSDFEKKEPENTKLMKKYFVDEVYDRWSDLYKSTYKIPAGKDFNKVVDDILKYFKSSCINPEKAMQNAKDELKEQKLDEKTGAEIEISMNTFSCKPLAKEKVR